MAPKTVTSRQSCPECRGAGFFANPDRPDGADVRCERCGGDTFIEVEIPDETVCAACNGEGCATCEGHGVMNPAFLRVAA